jgi:hypothetical protein
MPCALIVNTLADVLAELFFEAVCISSTFSLFHLTCVRGFRDLGQFHAGS